MNTVKMLNILTVLLLITMLACKNQGRSDKSSVNDRKPEGALWDQETGSVFYLIPSPSEILERFENAGLPFKPELLNPPGERTRYVTSRSKALNLGVYITDMAYSAMHERTSEAIDYLEAVKVLSYDVNISSGIFESLYDRAQRAAGNKDSIIALTSELFHDMTSFLEDGGSLNTIAMISAGAFIESMYITLESMGKFRKDHPALLHLNDLRYPLANLIGQSKLSENDPNVKSVIELLYQVNSIFTQLSIEKPELEVQKTGTSEISLLGGETASIGEKEFNQLKEKVGEIRQNIIRN